MERAVRQHSTNTIRELLNRSYEGVHTRLKKILDPEEIRFFARPVTSNLRWYWYADDYDTVTPFSELDDAQQEHAAGRLAFWKERIGKILEADEDLGKFAHDLFIVPSNDCIFAAENPNGSLEVFICQWACRAAQGDRNFDPLSFWLDRARKVHSGVDFTIR